MRSQDAGGGDPRVVLELEQARLVAGLGVQLGQLGLGVDHHAAELQAGEERAVLADPLLAEQDRAAVVQLHPHQGDQEDRAEQDDQAERADHVEEALAPARGLGGPRRVDVDQGKTADRAEPDAAAGDLGDARRDDHLHVLLLQCPGDPTQLARGADRPSGEEHHVGVGRQHRPGDLVGVADDGDAARRLAAALLLGVGGQRADHLVAEPRLPTQHSGDLVDVVGRPGDHDAVAERAVDAGAVHRSTQEQATKDQRRDRDHEHQQEEPAGQLVLREVAGHAHQAGGEQARVHDALVLVGTGAEDAHAVAAERDDREQPHDHDRRGPPADVLVHAVDVGRC